MRGTDRRTTSGYSDSWGISGRKQASAAAAGRVETWSYSATGNRRIHDIPPHLVVRRDQTGTLASVLSLLATTLVVQVEKSVRCVCAPACVPGQ